MLFVDAIDDEAASFYRSLGMRPLLHIPDTYHALVSELATLIEKT